MARLGYCFLLLALAGAVAEPAAAQFNPLEAIFGPMRPPGDVPNRAYPPAQRLPPGPPPSQQYPGQYPPSAGLPPGPPPGVQRQGLPPPPGYGVPPPGVNVPPQPGVFPQQGGLPRPAQPRRPAPAPGTPVTPPNDEIVISPASAKIANPTAMFSGLDKVTGRIITFDVAVNETVQFGALQVTPRVCYTRPPSETPNTDSFVEVDEVTLQGEVRRIFTGWMFAASPGLHAIEHPIYDVWLADCKGPQAPAVAEVDPGLRPSQRPPQTQRAKQPAQPKAAQPALPRPPPPPQSIIR
jgi:hypothetical protein